MSQSCVDASTFLIPESDPAAESSSSSVPAVPPRPKRRLGVRGVKRPYKRMPQDRLQKNVDLFKARMRNSGEKVSIAQTRLDAATQKFSFHSAKCAAYERELDLRASDPKAQPGEAGDDV